jgi:ferredoxin
MAEPKVMRVRVDSDRCQGHSRCCSIAPELFEADDLGNAHARGDGRVPQALEAKARLAVANCPEHAVRLTQE